MRRSLKYLNYGFFPPQRCKDTGFSTFLVRENWAFGLIRHWHGNKAILIEIASLLFIFADCELILEPRVYFSPTEKNRHNKKNKMSLASEANDKCRLVLSKEPFWKPVPTVTHCPARQCGGLALPPHLPSLKYTPCDSKVSLHLLSGGFSPVLSMV